MARSLSRIKEQIAKLQQEADSIQSSAITRIRKEIASLGLTAEHLFGSGAVTGSTKAAHPRTVSASKKKAAAKPAKYADEQGNSWGGMGKRPQWVHDVLAAGRSLEEFLVNAVKPAAGKAKATVARPPKAAPTPARKKSATKTRPAKAAAETAPKAKTPAKPVRKSAAASKKAPAKKTAAKKARAAKAPSRVPDTSDQANG